VRSAKQGGAHDPVWPACGHDVGFMSTSWP